MPLRFQLGARTLAAIPRRLERVALDLDAVLAERLPALPPLGPEEQGWLVTSIPAWAEPALRPAGFLRHVRQRYVRRYVDLSAGEATWRAELSAATRAGLARKRRRLAARGVATRYGGSAAALVPLWPTICGIAAVSWQARLLGAPLAQTPQQFLTETGAMALHGWVSSIDGQPAAFLLAAGDGQTLRYEAVGHEPALAGWSPGISLLDAAIGDCFAARLYDRFDFTEGDGVHKRQLASAGVACVDLLLLRATPANRAVIAALDGFAGAAGAAKRVIAAAR